MSSPRRSIHNLGRYVSMAFLAFVVLTLVGLGVIYAVRSAGDVGDYLSRALLVGAGLVVALLLTRVLGAPMPARIVLELDLSSLPNEAAGDGPLAAVMPSKALSLRDTVETIDAAATDDRVKAMIGYVTFDEGGLGTIQEVRDAVLRFREAGKRTIAFADSFGQLGGGNGSYYLASAFDEIIVQPSGEIGLTGLHRDVNFVKRALDKIGVAFHVEGRHEYKNAANQLVQTGFTEPHRESLERLMTSQWQQIVGGVATSRNLTEAVVQQCADQGPMFASAALEAGLIDRVGFRDEAVARVKELGGEGAELRWLARYRRFALRGKGRGRPTIAVVTGVGAIDRTKLPVNPLSPSASIGADKLAAAIRRATDDDKVKAIVVRVSSPGGSAVGSETMWREVVRAGEAGKPVIASMGDVAASGGYYLSMAAARIVAHPGTVTGSIGVVAQKPILAGAKEKLGFDVEELGTARNAGIRTLNRSFTSSESEAFSGWLDHIYEDFVSKAAAGRKRTYDEIHEVAKGRVWTGADAKERGLVDDLGGFSVALRHARELAGLAPDAKVRLVDYPKSSRISALRSGGGRNSDDPKALASLAAGIVSSPVTLALRLLGLDDPKPGALHCGLSQADWTIR